jgi:iron(III) transport system substrate-binding protein
MVYIIIVTAVSAMPLLLLEGCGEKADLVLYAAGDRIFSETVIREFRQATGLNVIIAGDTEVSRGVGLRNKIIEEKSSPRADVYWNNELLNTIILKEQELLTPYKSPSADDIPDAFRDAQGFWTAFGARARVFIVNTDLVKPDEMPSSMQDMLDPKWRKRVGISIITGGTTATHAAALFELLGDDKARDFYEKLKANDVVICNGNGHVKDQVADGELAWGWTDTNDANVALAHGKPVKVIYPDQGEGQIGTLLIPHSVSIIKGGPNEENARKFVDFLLRREMEEALAHSLSVQIPVRPGVKTPKEAGKNFIMEIGKIRSFNSRIDFQKVARRLPSIIRYMNDKFNH